jgi:hypothetical protein
MKQKIKCVGCKRELDLGERYLEKDPFFDKPVGTCCYDELKQQLVDEQDWHTLQEMEYSNSWSKVEELKEDDSNVKGDKK